MIKITPATQTLLAFHAELMYQLSCHPPCEGEISVNIESGVTHPKFVYELGEYRAEIRAMVKGEPVITLLTRNRLVTEYSNPDPGQNDLVIEAFAHHALQWLIKHQH